MIYEINETYHYIDSVLIVRNKQVVLEEYLGFRDDENTTHLMYSVTKSFTSAAVGIAIDKGYIDSTSETLLSFFPDREIDNLDERKESISIQNLLEMKSGMHWDETSAPYSSPDNGTYHINQGSGIQYCLDLPMVAEPNTIWHYNTGASHLLSGIVQVATNMSTRDFAREHLFTPLGFNPNHWYSDPQGVTKGGFDLRVTTRDAAKFGLLYLHNGTWDGEQIISANWVQNSVETITNVDTNRGYGMQWWTSPSGDYFYAAGLYGQYIVVVPRFDLIIVFTSGSGNPDYPHLRFVDDYVIPAVEDGADNDPFIPQSEPTTTPTDDTPSTPMITEAILIVIAIPAVAAVIIYTIKRIKYSE